MSVLNASAANVSCSCDCKRLTSLQSMEITELEFVQILVIVVAMLVMVVVITCLLNHYRLSGHSLLSRQTAAHRGHQPLANEGSLWSSEGCGTSSVLIDHQMYNQCPSDGTVPQSDLQWETQHTKALPPSQSQRFQSTCVPCHFQPTHPFFPQSLIDLPPTIALSDGEEPPPYQGPCTLQLRDPEQQMELNRESVRAPPNRTVFDSHSLHASDYSLQASLNAQPPGLHSGISTLESQDTTLGQQSHFSQLEGASPTYIEVARHYHRPPSLPPSDPAVESLLPPLILGLLQPPPQQQGSTDSRNARNTKEKNFKPQQV